MRLGMFFAIAATALLGASCSAQDFSTVVMDKPIISAAMPFASYAAVSNADGYLSTADTLGKYSFRYGCLSPNLYENKIGVQDDYMCGGYIDDNSNVTDGGTSEQPKWLDFSFASNTTYTISFDVRGGNRAETICIGLHHLDGSYERHMLWGPSYNTVSFSRLSVSFGVDAVSDRFFIGMYNWGGYLYVKTQTIMIQKGSVDSTPAYQPFAYGVSVETPFLKAPRSFALPLDANQKPDGQFTYNGFLNDGASWMFKYGYQYVDAAHPRTTQTCIGMTFVSEEQRSVFLEKFTDLALPRREYSNCSYVDYELSAVDATDGHCGIYLYFRPVFVSNTLVESYMSFNTGNYDDGYSDGYDYGYMVGYQAQTYEIVKGIEEVSLSYILGSGDEAEARTVTKVGVEAFSLLNNHCINGLLQLGAIYDELIPSTDSDAHSLSLLLSYADDKTVDAAPLYIDYKQLADPIPFAQQTQIIAYIPVNLPIQRWNAFSAYLDVGYQGDLGNYPNQSYDARFRSYNHIQVKYPTRYVGGELNYLGVLSDYTRGYAAGLALREGEVNDLTQQILDLKEDLADYQGMSYSQIYEAGRQAGINAGNAANSMMSGLFGAVLSVPLSIFGGLSEFSVLGVSVMSLIMSLLVVAVAVMVLKRFL